MSTTIGPEWPKGQAVERAENALHEAGWFVRADLHPDTIRALLWDLADADLLT